MGELTQAQVRRLEMRCEMVRRRRRYQGAVLVLMVLCLFLFIFGYLIGHYGSNHEAPKPRHVLAHPPPVMP